MALKYNKTVPLLYLRYVTELIINNLSKNKLADHLQIKTSFLIDIYIIIQGNKLVNKKVTKSKITLDPALMYT
jgi:hypothetical protein